METTKKTEKTLTPEQEKFITASLTEKTITRACKKIGISNFTYYNWLKDPLFKEKLEEERHNLNFLIRQEIKDASLEAIAVLKACLKSKEENQRRLSAQAIIDLFLKVKDGEIWEKVEVLYKEVKKREGYR